MFMNLFTNILLCLNLAHLINKLKLGLELDLFAKQTNINKLTFSRTKFKLFINNLVNLITVLLDHILLSSTNPYIYAHIYIYIYIYKSYSQIT